MDIEKRLKELEENASVLRMQIDQGKASLNATLGAIQILKEILDEKPTEITE